MGKHNINYEIEPEVEIDAPPENVWNFLIDVENWWLKSNPEHDSLTINGGDKELGVGTKLTIKEKIAGIPCKAKGTVTGYDENKLVEWKAIYYLLSLRWIKVQAGVRWKLTKINQKKTALMANVWADFPNQAGYKVLFFIFKNFLNGIEKDYKHAMKELKYIKVNLERGK